MVRISHLYVIPLYPNSVFVIGEYIFDRKLVAKLYIKRWFILDCLGNIPFSMFKAFPGKASLDDFSNFIHFNFAYIPRFYIFCMALKLFRIRNV